VSRRVTPEVCSSRRRTIWRLPLVVRTWNVFHGNTFPPGRSAYLREMVEIAIADAPDVVCLQELPLWGVSRLERWSGMQVFPAVARKPRVPGRVGEWLTRLHHGFFRSAFVGQANAILVARPLSAENLGTRRISDPGREPRVVQAVRVDGRFVVVNLHASTTAAAALVEVDRALELAESHAGPDEAVILAGDFNLSEFHLDGYTEPAGGIDHVLVRGAPVSPAAVWPPARRALGDRLLSDHPVVEVTIDPGVA
jgi:endonuclease/exonuclease/phosphatase family metal-dependent hydrolase